MPTTPSVAGGSTGATISGSVIPNGVSLAGVRVSVSGQTQSSVISSQQFALSSVPAGTVTLHFEGSGVNADMPVGTLTSSSTLTVSVQLSSTSATLESSIEDDAEGREIEGRVDGLPPVTAVGTFSVAGHLITTNSSTTFVQGGTSKTFADLTIGMRVHVRADAGGGSTILAREVRLQNALPDVQTEVNGIVAGFTSSVSGFQFTINGTTVKGDATTSLTGGVLADLVNGIRVEVKVTPQNGFVQALTIHINGDDGDDENEVELTGAISGLSSVASCPVVTFVVQTKTVVTSAATEFKKIGCSALVSGTVVEVKGLLQADGTIKATKVQKD